MYSARGFSSLSWLSSFSGSVPHAPSRAVVSVPRRHKRTSNILFSVTTTTVQVPYKAICNTSYGLYTHSPCVPREPQYVPFLPCSDRSRRPVGGRGHVVEHPRSYTGTFTRLIRLVAALDVCGSNRPGTPPGPVPRPPRYSYNIKGGTDVVFLANSMNYTR